MVKEWRDVTFMKEWVKPMYIGYHQALELPKNLFPFSRTRHLKISLGPTQFLYSKSHGLLKLIFHTNQYNALCCYPNINSAIRNLGLNTPTAPIFLQFNCFRENIWVIIWVQFHFLYIFVGRVEQIFQNGPRKYLSS